MSIEILKNRPGKEQHVILFHPLSPWPDHLKIIFTGACLTYSQRLPMISTASGAICSSALLPLLLKTFS